MNILRPLCALAVVASLTAGAQKINPITQAVLNGYTELLQEDPKDYQTLYERAAQYYQLGLLDQAKDDLTAALQYTPQKDSDLRQRELTLLSNVAVASEDYELALTAVEDALALKPSDYYNVFKKGNILLLLDRPDEAYRTFSSMQSLRSRSQEAYYGMAKACIRKKDFAEAETLIKEVENAAPTNPVTFTRLGDLYLDMEQPENAAANYIVSMSMGDAGAAPMQALVDMARTNYKAVATALDFAAEKSDNKAMMLFLKGNIALDSGNYTEAEDAFVSLLKQPDTQVAGVYASLARARFALGNLPGAMEAVNQAINLKTAAEYYALKARIEIANGNFHGAIADAAEALRVDADLADAYVISGEAYIGAGQGEEAVKQLNQAIMLAPDDMKALLLRAYANQELNGNPKLAVADFNRIILESPESFPDIAIKGIAQVKTGKKLDADALLQNALSGHPSPADLYWGAVYYAQTGNLDRAKTLADQASFDGFRDTYLLKDSNTPWLSLAPIRHLMK